MFTKCCIYLEDGEEIKRPMLFITMDIVIVKGLLLICHFFSFKSDKDMISKEIFYNSNTYIL